MSDKLDGMPSDRQVVDPATGEIRAEWFDFFEELVFGTSERSVGTVLSGVNSILSGEAVLQDVVLADRGSLVADQAAQDGTSGNSNEFNASASSTVLSAVGTGTVATSSITISVSGGTAPYSISYSNAGSVTASGSTTLGADGDFSVSWSGSPAGGIIGGLQTITITDSAGSPLTAEVFVSVSIRDSAFGF